MILDTNNTALLIIDIQEKLINVSFNKEQILKNSVILSTAGKILNLPLLVTEQYPKGLGATIPEIKTANQDGKYYEKVDFNALTDENLLSNLKQLQKKQIILFGIETHICVHQTAYALIKNGFDVIIARDACGSRKEEEYLFALEQMKNYGAHLKTTEMVLFELIKSSKHPKFKEVQALIK